MATKKKIASKATRPLAVGNKVLIRTVTHYHLGLVEEFDDDSIILSSASWIADTRRFHVALRDGLPSEAEVEPFPDPVQVALGAVVDITTWRHDLPRDAR